MSTPYGPPGPSGGGQRLDVGPLTAPVDGPQLDAFIADSKATDKPWKKMTTGFRRPGLDTFLNQLLPVLFPTIAIIAIGYIGGPRLIGALWRFVFEVGFPWNLVIVGFFVLLAFGLVMLVVRIIGIIRSLIVPRWWWEAAYRLVGFAGRNGLRYGHDETASYPGVIFHAGSDRTIERRLTTTSGRRVEIGNYRYVVRGDDNDNVKVFGWGYVAIKLDRRLPHLLLDAKQNDTSVFGIRSSNLPVDLARDQRLTLGGQFDEKFTLYAPSDYGRDAFQIFAPDLMALFIDRLGTFDVEIVDDTMFCYGGRFDLLDPATYAWLTELVETVIARTVRRTARYRDDFALLESDPASRPTAPAGPPPEEPASSPGRDEGAGTGFQLFPGFVLGPAGVGPVTAPGGPVPTTTQPEPATTQEPVFAFAGDGPPQTATNTVAERGRRLRSRRWGLWSVVGLLFVAFWIYNSFVAPIFGWPHLPDNN